MFCGDDVGLTPHGDKSILFLFYHLPTRKISDSDSSNHFVCLLCVRSSAHLGIGPAHYRIHKAMCFVYDRSTILTLSFHFD